MKINDSIKHPIDLTKDKLAVNSDKKAGKASARTALASSESVSLSPLSTQMKSLEAKVANAGVFDAKKVEEIKSAITGGQFQVNSDKVADGLISSVKEFLSAQEA